MVAEIRALDPKPGLAFAHEPVRALIPDVFVRRAPDGGWTRRAERRGAAAPHRQPHLLRQGLARALPPTRSADICADCLQKASWLEKSLDQRARTVLSVASEIVRRQDGFLADGVAHLKPLNLRMVADALGIHESTVSRAAANKTIATPRGIFEFRYFFTGAIAATAGGEAHSAEAVKHRIRKLIARGIAGRRALRRCDRRDPFARRHRDRAPHRRQIPRAHADRLVGGAAAREASQGRLLIDEPACSARRPFRFDLAG